MADISIERDKATSWMNDVKQELELVEQLLQKVSASTSTTPGEDDVIMKGIEKTCQSLSDFWKNMCGGFKSASNLLDNALKNLSSTVEDVIDDITNVKAKIGH